MTGFLFRDVAGIVTVLLIPWIVTGFLIEDYSQHIANTAFLLGFIVVNLIGVYYRETHIIKFTNLSDALSKEVETTNNLLR
mmetsp:Transcript_37152/g.6633  ORF Transcript_37152/g.6633 Transcript_37152/m.6633 type:complete len:81 (+) Transcript_37152:165-407(+)